jgi:hypothetical protein
MEAPLDVLNRLPLPFLLPNWQLPYLSSLFLFLHSFYFFTSVSYTTFTKRSNNLIK